MGKVPETKVPEKRPEALVPESLTRLYRRMAKAFRSDPPPEAVAIARLSRVVEVHHGAAAALQAAIERSDPGARRPLQELHGEEVRLAHAIGALVAQLGGSAPRAKESALNPPHDPSAMSGARDQAELMSFVRDNRGWVVSAHRELAGLEEIPVAMQRKLEALFQASNTWITSSG